MDPPATDISTQPFFWSSFNISPKRIQNGGWARELTSEDFAISDEIAGVNMHLAPGGIRELHWHQTAEWAVITRGKCRITTIDALGRPSVDDVEEGDAAPAVLHPGAWAMSALRPIADIRADEIDVRYVPTTDISDAIRTAAEALSPNLPYRIPIRESDQSSLASAHQ